MFKRTYNLIYRIRPNKKTEGVRHAQNMTFNGKLTGNEKNQAKMLRALCAIHRVNPSAILMERITLVSVRIGLFDRIRDMVKKVFSTGGGVQV